ncbi:MAG: hypothetical protein HC900_12005 [Methylacidiphilales bacterium]|nr:hypothetical protein [Candidatus Methylacidiphilales bacterium]
MDETDRVGWSAEAVHALRELAQERVPVHMMSLRLKRPVESIMAKLNELGLTTALASEPERRAG